MCLSDNDENIALAVLDKETILFLAEAAEPGGARPLAIPLSTFRQWPAAQVAADLSVVNQPQLCKLINIKYVAAKIAVREI